MRRVFDTKGCTNRFVSSLRVFSCVFSCVFSWNFNMVHYCRKIVFKWKGGASPPCRIGRIKNTHGLHRASCSFCDFHITFTRVRGTFHIWPDHVWRIRIWNQNFVIGSESRDIGDFRRFSAIFVAKKWTQRASFRIKLLHRSQREESHFYTTFTSFYIEFRSVSRHLRLRFQVTFAPMSRHFPMKGSMDGPR